MSRKLIFPLLCLVCLLIAASLAYAQVPTDAIDDALRDLSQRLHQTITLDSLTQWTWSENLYNDASLGCPQSGQTYTPQSILGYELDLTYNGITYDYHVSEDRTILILCSPLSTPTPHPPVNTPAALPTISLPPTIAPTATNCPALPARLIIGQPGRVSPGLPNNLREQPGESGHYLGEIPAGGEFVVLAGPVCGSQMNWWQVNYNSKIGWTPEGKDQTYWLEPLTLSRPAISAANIGQVSAGPTFQATDGVGPLAWSPDGNKLAVVHQQEVMIFASPALVTPPNILLTGSVNALAFNADGSKLALAAADNTIRLWDTRGSGEQIILLSGHTQMVSSVDWNANANLIASGSWDGTIRLWEEASGLQRAVIEAGSGVSQVAFSANGLLLASAHQDGTVSVWDVGSQSKIAGFQVHQGIARAVAFSPNGHLLASAGDDQKINLWDTTTWTLTRTLTGSVSAIQSIAFSPDGTVLLSGGGNLLNSAQSDNGIHAWDVFGGTQLAALNADGVAAIISIAFNPDGTQFAISRQDGTVQIWGIGGA